MNNRWRAQVKCMQRHAESIFRRATEETSPSRFHFKLGVVRGMRFRAGMISDSMGYIGIEKRSKRR